MEDNLKKKTQRGPKRKVIKDDLNQKQKMKATIENNNKNKDGLKKMEDDLQKNEDDLKRRKK